MKQITLGSLFDGAGGFPYAGTLAGITPIWASEIEPFPIKVTKKRFPHMKHLGNITEINGGEIPPVDIITFGSPCQDLSVANGNRKGLEGSRSGLFREAIRIIKEMREATHGTHPTFIIWENVPGAFSSNGGDDYQTVIEEIVKIKYPDYTIPADSKWETDGAIVGEDAAFSLAWRVYDAQFWGVPQRRCRIYLVADFRGERAPKIQFERESLLGDIAPSRQQREETATATGNRAETTGGDRGTIGGNGRDSGSVSGLGECDSKKGIDYLTPWDSQSKRVFGESGVSPAINGCDGKGGRDGGIVMAAGFKGHNGITANPCYKEERVPCLETHMPPNVLAELARGGWGGTHHQSLTEREQLSERSSIT